MPQILPEIHRAPVEVGAEQQSSYARGVERLVSQNSALGAAGDAEG